MRTFLPLLFGLFLCTCDRAPLPASTTETKGKETTSSPAATAPAAPTATLEVPYQVEDGALMGMKPGEPLAPFAAGLRAGILRTGEGDFPVFYIDGAEGSELGYLMADDAGEQITDVVITSPDVLSPHGLSIGMPYANLRQRATDFVVRGSEIEGHTYALVDGYAYRLASGNWQLEVDPATIADDTRILSISLP